MMTLRDFLKTIGMLPAAPSLLSGDAPPVQAPKIGRDQCGNCKHSFLDLDIRNPAYGPLRCGLRGYMQVFPEQLCEHHERE